MSRKNRTIFVCNHCGHQEPKGVGRCPACQEWGTMEEGLPLAEPVTELHGLGSMQEPQVLNEVSLDDSIRIKTEIGEFDRLIGGGLVAGSVVLLVGDPGIGKSTLSLLAAGNVANRYWRHLVAHRPALDSPDDEMGARRRGK